MAPNKQPKITAHVSASVRSDANEGKEKRVEPMSDVDVHTQSQNVQSNQTETPSQHTSSTSPTSTDTNDNERDDETVHARNDPPPLQFTRCDMKIIINGNTDDYYLVALQQIQAFFVQVQKEDEFAQLAPWKDTDDQPLLPTPNDIPSEEEQAQDYFKGLNPRDDKSGTQQLWFKVRIGHTVEMDDLKRSLGRFLSKRKWTLAPLTLQVERTVCLGCFQYSHGNMDFPHLARSIEKVIGIPVQLRWRIISKGWQSGPMDDAEKIRAIHVEVDSKVAKKALESLSTHFGKSRSTLPGGRRMRFFPEFNRVRSQDNQNKILEMRKRQGNFLQTVEKVFSNNIHLLDKQIHVKGDDNTTKVIPTLRSLVQSIKSFQPGMTHLPLFHSVDVAWAPRGQDKGHCFLVMPHLRKESSIMIKNLLPYLRFHHGDHVEKYFSQDCVDANEGALWDDVNKCVISTIETNLNDGDDDEEDFIGLNLAMKYNETKNADPPTTSDNNAPPPRPDPSAPATTTQKTIDAPIPPTATGNEYYRQEDDLSSIGMSATHTVQDTANHSSSQSRATLGNLPRTIQASTSHSHQQSTSNTNSSLAPSSVFHPVTIPNDAQTTASSVTMESMMQKFEQREHRQDQILEKMMNMMTTIAQNQKPSSSSPSFEKAGDKT